MGWRCEGRDIDQYVEDLYLHDPAQSYEQGHACSSFYKPSSMRRFGILGSRIVLDLVKALKHDSPKVRWNAAAALSFVGPSADLALPELITLLEDPEPGVQRVAAWTLRKRRDGALPLMLSKLESRPEMAPALCFALGFFGPPAALALPTLQSLEASDSGWSHCFDEAISRLSEKGDSDPQSIRGVQIDFDLEDCQSQDDFEWISFCSEVYGIENSLPRYSYGETYFAPDRPVLNKPVVNLSILSSACSSEARLYLRDGRAWDDHGILVQDIGRSFRIYIRIQSEGTPYLSQSDLLYQSFEAFRKHCSGNRWTMFDRLERYHGFGPDEKTVYQLMLD